MMILRSSSSPILSSLLSSSSFPHHFNESPNNHHNHLEKSSSFSSSSFLHPLKHSGSFHISSPPPSDSSPHQNPSSLGFRRAQSEGNLHSLNHVLDSIPSFSMYDSNGQEEGFNEEGGNDQFNDGKGGGDGFSFVGQNQNLNLVGNCGDNGGYVPALPLFLARGLGIDRIGSGLLNAAADGGGGNGNGEEKSEIEMYYRRMVDENPSNALFLSNYAQFLYQSKGDAKRAEVYYSRAILAEPGDGEILSHYAKLVWELHHDKEHASSYFEQAVHATPNESNVLAAYASFLWETDDDDGDGDGDGEGLDSNYQEYSGTPHEILA